MDTAKMYLSLEDFTTAVKELNEKVSDFDIQCMYETIYGTGNLKQEIMNTIGLNGPITGTTTSKYVLDDPIKSKEGEKPMCYKYPASAQAGVAVMQQPTVEMTQRDFLSDRVKQEVNKLRENLRKQFFLAAQESPENALELIERIKADDFTLDDEAVAQIKKNPKNYWSVFHGINWGKNKADYDGFKAADAALKIFAQETIDVVTLGSIEEGRAALAAVKDWKYEAPKASKK